MRAETADSAPPENPVRALLIAGLLGAAAGLIVSALCSLSDDSLRMWGLPGIGFAITFAGAFILLDDRRSPARAVTAPTLIAALVGVLTLWRAWQAGTVPDPYDDDFMLIFWTGVCAPLLVFLILTLTATARETGRFEFPHRIIFRHAVRLPVAAGMGAAIGVAAALFITLWAEAFSSLGADLVKTILTSRWILLTVVGTASGIGAAFTLRNSRLLGAGEVAAVIGARILLPLLAVFSALFAVILPFTGLETLGETLSPTGLLLALAIAAKLVFNGVYGDGSQPPIRPLRWAVWLSLIVLPVYAVMALYGIGIRVIQHGLTPERFIVLAVASMVASYTVLLLIGLISELRKSPTWMPPVARLNSAFAMIWVALLILVQTPILDPLAWSARDQTARLKSQSVSVAEFDFAAMQFKFGRPGHAALKRMQTWTSHPQSQRIAQKVTAVMAEEYYSSAKAAQKDLPPEIALPESMEQNFEQLDAEIETADADFGQKLKGIATRLRAFECQIEQMEPDNSVRKGALEQIQSRKNIITRHSYRLENEMSPVSDALEAECGAPDAAATSN